MTAKKWNDPVHPGEILAEELEQIGMTASILAQKIGVPRNRLYQIVSGTRSMTADTALRLGAFFGTGPRIWLNLQKNYELDVAARGIGKTLKKIVPYQKPKSSSEEMAIL